MGSVGSYLPAGHAAGPSLWDTAVWALEQECPSRAFLFAMSKFLLGTKIGMTQLFNEGGVVTPVTLIQVRPNVVVQVKTAEKDGYTAVQLGTGTKKNLSKAAKGHAKNLGSFRYLRETKLTSMGDKDLSVGDALDVSLFAVGDKVKVAGLTKGKGFAGAVKRHGFHGAPASHGHHHVLRHVGSIGQRFPQHTLKGTRGPGRDGQERVTIRGLTVVAVDAEQGVLAVRGAVPGNRGQLLEITALS